MKKKKFKMLSILLLIILLTSDSFSQKKARIGIEKFQDERIAYTSFLIFGEFTKIISFSDKLIVGISKNEFALFLEDEQYRQRLGNNFVDTTGYETATYKNTPYKLVENLISVNKNIAHIELRILHEDGYVGSANLSLPLDNFDYGPLEKKKIRNACFELIRSLDSDLYKLKDGQLVEKAFSNNNFDVNFNVLILPLLSINGNSNKIDYHIKDGIQYLNHKSELNINVRILDEFIPGVNLDLKQLQNLLDYHNAHLVVYGDYIITDNIVRLGYLFNANEQYYKQGLYETNGFYSKINDFRTGKIKGNVDFIVYWVSAMANLNRFRFEDADLQFQYLLDNFNGEDAPIAQTPFYESVISAFLRYGDHKKTKKYLSKFIEVINENNLSNRDRALHFQLYAQYENSLGSFSKGKELAFNALKLLDENNIKDKKLYLNVLVTIQLSLGNLGENDNAIKYGNMALDSSFIQNRSAELESIIYCNLGAANNAKGRLDSGNIYIKKSIELLHSNRYLDSTVLAINYGNLAYNYFLQDINVFDSSAISNLLIAEDLMMLSLELIRKYIHPKNSLRAIYESNMGIIYNKKAFLFPNQSQEYYDKSIFHLKHAIDILEESSPKSEYLIKMYTDISSSLIQQKKFNEAEFYIKKLTILNEELYFDQPEKMFPQYVLVSAFYLHGGDMEMAHEFYKFAQDQFNKIPQESDNYETNKLLIDHLKTKTKLNNNVPEYEQNRK